MNLRDDQPPAPGRVSLSARESMLDDIMARLIERLEAAGNPLLDDPEVYAQFSSEARSVIERAMDMPNETLSVPPVPNESGTHMGVVRARQQVHPHDSLQAAALLFDVAITVAGEQPDQDLINLTRALNSSIMSTLVPASTAYVNVLLERLAVAHAEERRRISRDVHDRIAHGIAVAIQHVRQNPNNPSEAQTNVLLELLERLMIETSEIAIDLRHTVDEDLDVAVRDYVADLRSAAAETEVVTVGTPVKLPAGVQEEAFMVVREAIRNAQRHANATTITVTLTWEEGSLQIDVSDDGNGYQRENVRSGALGLTAARERADLIGAELHIRTKNGEGTVITLRIPGRPQLP